LKFDTSSKPDCNAISITSAGSKQQPSRRLAQPGAEDILVWRHPGELPKNSKEIVAAQFRLPGKHTEPLMRIRATLYHSNDSGHARFRSRMNPVTGHEEHQTGRRIGSEIIQIGARSNGTPTRWRFTDVTPDSFRWIGERSDLTAGRGRSKVNSRKRRPRDGPPGPGRVRKSVGIRTWTGDGRCSS
jgi:hypothetical protein